MKRLAILLLLFIVPLAVPATLWAQEGEECFFRANQAYREGRFQEAVTGYEDLIRSGHENGHIYYNLGNAFLRNNDLGRAILSYERARLFIPRDGDLNFNLRYALDRTVDAIPDSPGFLSQTFFWLDDLTLRELFYGFAVLNILFWGVLILRLLAGPEWSYYAFLVLLILWLITGVSMAAKWVQVEGDDRAVVLVEEVDILAGPESRDTVLFRLHRGALVRYERSEEGWTLIRLSAEKRGWVPAGTLERIMERDA